MNKLMLIIATQLVVPGENIVVSRHSYDMSFHETKASSERVKISVAKVV